MANRNQISKGRLLSSDTRSNRNVRENKTSEKWKTDLDEGSFHSSSSSDPRNSKTKLAKQKSSRMMSQDQLSTKRRLLPSDTSGDDSVQEHKKSEKWWEVLNEGSYPSPSSHPRYGCNSLSPRNSESKHLMQNSRSFNSQRASGSGFSCSDFSMESKEMSRIMPLRKAKKVFVSPRQYNMAISNETTIAFEKTLHRSSDPNISSFKIETSLDEFSRDEENINPLFNRRPKRKIEHSNNFSRVLSDVAHVVSHTSVTDAVYERVDDNNSCVIGEVACGIYESEKYEAPATATYCRQTVERNGATTTYVTISEVKERVHVQNRSCRVPSKKSHSPFEFSGAVTDLSYDSDCMFVQHVSSPNRQSSRHIHSDSEKKERNLQLANRLDILIETQNPMESFSVEEVEDVSDLHNRSGPIESKKCRKSRDGENKHLLAICSNEFEEVLDKQSLSCEKNLQSPPKNHSLDNIQTSSFSMSESLERSGKKRSGRKIRKQTKGASFPQELSEKTSDVSGIGSFNENTIDDIPDYSYFTNKRKRRQMEQKMSIKSGLFADAFDFESVSVSRCSPSKNSCTNSGSNYTTEGNASQRSYADKMVLHHADQSSESDSVQMRAKSSTHGHTFKSDSLEIQDLQGYPAFQKKERKIVLPISLDAFADALNSDSVLSHTGLDSADNDHLVQPNEENFFTKGNDLKERDVINVLPNEDEMLSQVGYETSGKKLLRSGRKKYSGSNSSLHSVRSLEFDDKQNSSIFGRKGRSGTELSINASQFAEALDSDTKTSRSASKKASSKHSFEEAHSYKSAAKEKKFSKNESQSLDEVSSFEIDGTFETNKNPLLQRKQRKKFVPSQGSAELVQALAPDTAREKTSSKDSHKKHVQGLNGRDSIMRKSLFLQNNGNSLNDSVDHKILDTLSANKLLQDTGEENSDESQSVSSENYNEMQSPIIKRRTGNRRALSINSSEFGLGTEGKASSSISFPISGDCLVDLCDPNVSSEKSTSFEGEGSGARPIKNPVNSKKMGPSSDRDASQMRAMKGDSQSLDEVISLDIDKMYKNNSHQKKKGNEINLRNNSNVFTDPLGCDEKSDAPNFLHPNILIDKSVREDRKMEQPMENETQLKMAEEKQVTGDESQSLDEISLVSDVDASDVGPFLRRKRKKKNAIHIDLNTFGDTSSGNDCTTQSSNWKSASRKSISVKISEPGHEDVQANMMKVAAKSDSLVDGKINKNGINESKPIGEGEKINSNKFSSSKSVVNEESQSIGDHSSIDNQNVPVFQRNRVKKAALPVNSMIFAGVLGSDSVSDSSRSICPSEAGVENDDAICEKLNTISENVSVLDRETEKNGLTENWRASTGSSVTCGIDKGNPIPSSNEEGGIKKAAKLVGSDANSNKFSSSKSVVNEESQSIGDHSSIDNQNVPVFQRNRVKKAALPVNSMIFAGVLGSDSVSDSSRSICPSEAGVENDDAICEKLNTISENVSVLDRETEKNGLTENWRASTGSSVTCGIDKGNPIPSSNEEGGIKKAAKLVGSDANSNKFSSSKSVVNEESQSIGDHSSIDNQNVPVFQRNRVKKAALPVNSMIFAGVLGSDSVSDSSRSICPSEAGVENDDAICEKLNTISENVSVLDRETEKNGLTENWRASTGSSVTCGIDKGNPIPSSNEEEGREKAAKLVGSDANSNKFSSSKSVVNEESQSIGDHSSINNQNAPVFQRNRVKKAALPVNSMIFAGVLGSDSVSDSSRSICPSEAGVLNEDPACKKVIINENVSLPDKKAENNGLTDNRSLAMDHDMASFGKGEPSLCFGENRDVRREKKVADVMCSDAESSKFGTSKSTVTVESMPVGDHSSNNEQNSDFQNKQEKAALPTTSSVPTGILVTDPESNYSSTLHPSAPIVGNRVSPSCENVKTANENVLVLGRVAEKNEPTESSTVGKDNKSSHNKEEANLNFGENKDLRGEEKVMVLDIDSKSNKCRSSKSTMNNDNNSAGENSSFSNQNVPVFHRNRGKKTALAINSSVFTGVLGSDPEFESSSATCPSEVMVGDKENDPCGISNTHTQTGALTDGKGNNNVQSDTLLVSKDGDTLKCNENKEYSNLRKEMKEKDDFLTWRNEAAVVLASDSRAKRSDSLVVSDESLLVGEKKCIENVNAPVYQRIRGKKVPLPIDSSVFAQVLGTDLDSSSTACPSESVVVEKEVDSLLPDGELNVDAGYFESTRGFIATDTKSPFSRISKHFGDVSCIMKESSMEKNSFEEEGGEAVISGRGNSEPNNVKSSLKVEDVEIMLKSMNVESCEIVDPMVCLSNHSQMHKIPGCSLSHDSHLKLSINEIQCPLLRKMNFTDSACADQLLKPDSMGIESIPLMHSPIHEKEADTTIANQLLAKSPVRVDLFKDNNQVLENMNTVVAVIPSSHSTSLEQKEIVASDLVIFPEKHEKMHLSEPTCTTKSLGNGSKAMDVAATSPIVPIQQKQDISSKHELIPQPPEALNLTIQESTRRNLMSRNTACETIQPSPVVPSPQKEVLSSPDKPLPKSLEVNQIPRQATTGRNFKRRNRTAIPIPIVSKGAKQGVVVSTNNEMPSGFHIPSKSKIISKFSSSPAGMLPLANTKTSPIASKIHMVSGDKPTSIDGEVIVTSSRMENTTDTPKPLTTAKRSPSVGQGVSLAHSSSLLVAGNKVSMDIPTEGLLNEMPTINDVTFVKEAADIAHEGSCINNRTFTVGDSKSEQKNLPPTSAHEVNNLTFNKSSSKFDPITLPPFPEESASEVLALVCDLGNKVVPQGELSNANSFSQVIEIESEVSTPNSDHIDGAIQAFLGNNSTSVKLPNVGEMAAQAVIASPESGNRMVNPEIYVANLDLVKSISDSEQIAQTPASQTKMVDQLVSPASPVSQSKAIDASQNCEISSSVLRETFVQVEPDHQNGISQQATEIPKERQENLEEFTEKGPAVHASEEVIGKPELITGDISTVNSPVGGVPEALVHVSQSEVAILRVSHVEEVDDLVSVVSVANTNAEILHPILQEELNNFNVEASPLQHTYESDQAVSLHGSNVLSEVEVKSVESGRRISSFNIAPPECVAANMKKPAETVMPIDDFPPAVITDHHSSHGETKSIVHSLIKDNTDHQLLHGEIKSNLHYFVKDSTGNSSKNFSTRTKIVEKVCSLGGSSVTINEPCKPRPSNSRASNFMNFDQTCGSELLMLSPLNLRLISSESSGPSTSSSAVYSGHCPEIEFSGNNFEIPKTSKSEESLHQSHKSTRDSTPSLNNESSGPIFSVEQSTDLHGEASSREDAISHCEQQAAAISVKLGSVKAKKFWFTSHGEESGPVTVTSGREGSVSTPNSQVSGPVTVTSGGEGSLSTPNSQVSGPIRGMGRSNESLSKERAMVSSRENSVTQCSERLEMESHKREKLIESSSAKICPSSHYEESEQSCSSQMTEGSNAPFVNGIKKGDNSNSSATNNIDQIVDNVLRKLDEACAQQTQQEMEQAKLTMKRFNSWFPTKLSPDKKKKLKSCARIQVPNLRKRQDRNEKAVEKHRRLPAWCSKTLKKAIVEAMEVLEMPYLDQEEFLFDFTDTVKQVMKSKDVEEVKDGVFNVQKRLFDLKIIRSLSDFFQFVRQYLPREFRCRSIPCLGWDDPIYASWVDVSDLNKPLFQ